MRRFIRAIVLVASAGTVSAQQPATPKTIPEMWNAWCARCHASDGSGKVSEPTVTVTPMDFTDCRIATAEPDADWEAAIAHGGPSVGLSSQMPAFGDSLTQAQIRELVAHMRRFCSEAGWPSGNLNLPRPMFTEKAFPENEVVITPVASHRQDRTSFALRAIYERRIGKQAQFEVALPFESIAADRRHSGFGDFEVGLKYVLTPRSNHHLLSAGLDVAVPTGSRSRGLGSGTVIFEPYVASAMVASSFYIQGQLKLELPADTTRSDREVAYGVYLGRDTSMFPDTWTIGLEINGENDRLALTPQLRKALTRTGALSAAVGARLPINKREEQGIRWIGYLLWEYLEPVLPAR